MKMVLASKNAHKLTEMKDSLSGYLSVLFEQNPKSVGGALPDDAFYYSR